MVGYYVLALSVVVSLVVGVLVASQSVTDRRNQLFTLLTFTFIVLSVANTLSLDVKLDQLFFIRAVMSSASIAVFLIYLLIRAIQSAKPFLNTSLRLLMIATAVIAILDWTPVIFTGYVAGSPPRPVPGFGAALFFIHFVLVAVLSVVALRKRMQKAKHHIRGQYRAMIVGLIPILVLAPVTSFLLPIVFHLTGLIVVSPLYTAFFVILVGYAIARHGLFDVKQAAVRTTAYASSLAVLAIIYYFLAYVASVTLFHGSINSSISVSPVNVVLALLLAFIFQPIKQFFDRITDNVFFRDRYSTDEFYTRLSEVLTATTDLRTLLQRAAVEIGATLKADQAFFFVQYDGVHRMTAGTKHHKDLPTHDVQDLNRYVEKHGTDVIVVQLLTTNLHVKRMLQSHGIAILMPLVRHGEILGYLALGDQKSSGYTNRDTRVLRTISDELVIAIQNALSVQEVRDVNASLEQRIDAATAELRTSNARLKRLDAAKDEFLSMASHQLRTPLTSVKGYLSMMLDGDVGKITAMQRQVLEEAFSSSERMVHLIHDFLNVSRLQTGKFALELQESDLSELVKQEVNSLERVAKSRDMSLEFSNKAGSLPMTIDDTKIRQVVMNYIDNAIFYSHPGTTIKIGLAIENKEVVLKVEDTGIGVPKHEQERLFTKFYRATNARRQRPDGTGVGLFLAQKVMSAHGGEVLFESKEGRRGSIFGFRLPLSAPSKD